MDVISFNINITADDMIQYNYIKYNTCNIDYHIM